MDLGLWASTFIFLLILIEFFRLNNLQKEREREREREWMDLGLWASQCLYFLPPVYLRDALFK